MCFNYSCSELCLGLLSPKWKFVTSWWEDIKVIQNLQLQLSEDLRPCSYCPIDICTLNTIAGEPLVTDTLVEDYLAHLLVLDTSSVLITVRDMNTVSQDSIAVGGVTGEHAGVAEFRLGVELILLSWTTLLATSRAPGTSLVCIVPVARAATLRECVLLVRYTRAPLARCVLIAEVVHRVATLHPSLLTHRAVGTTHVPPTPSTFPSSGVLLEYCWVWSMLHCWAYWLPFWFWLWFLSLWLWLGPPGVYEGETYEY